MKDCEKYYYVFTDSQRIIEKYKNIQNIVITYQEQLCRPLNTLLRFYMFKKIEKQLEEKDFLLFFNANTLFLEEITKDEFLPD
ncbi:MAG: hypothetical protein LBQ24_07015 [Candidatus Peribacteria bacterium]|nr:hypothetical protein [Candidatus Peribacteria bacterium]